MDRCQFSEFTFGYCVTEDFAVRPEGRLLGFCTRNAGKDHR